VVSGERPQRRGQREDDVEVARPEGPIAPDFEPTVRVETLGRSEEDRRSNAAPSSARKCASLQRALVCEVRVWVWFVASSGRRSLAPDVARWRLGRPLGLPRTTARAAER
jgi:hypothetical protein